VRPGRQLGGRLIYVRVAPLAIRAHPRNASADMKQITVRFTDAAAQQDFLVNRRFRRGKPTQPLVLAGGAHTVTNVTIDHGTDVCVEVLTAATP
jgi:hypothetical protein